MLEDERFADCPLSQAGIRFHAGAPLTTRSGYTLGAMCVLDATPRVFTPEQVASLEDFAAMVMSQIELQHEAGHVRNLCRGLGRDKLIGVSFKGIHKELANIHGSADGLQSGNHDVRHRGDESRPGKLTPGIRYEHGKTIAEAATGVFRLPSSAYIALGVNQAVPYLRPA